MNEQEKMMERITKEGGPAYPLESNGYVYVGMTLRDHFAAKALQSILDQIDFHDSRARLNAVWLSYQIADAMLAEREK